ncbi:FKBP-type peptidyl-prolyl cis-trans isomerase [Lysobacter sp. N42]|uniref:FKBP-type peptidyl-prolyl cis-trans isomerase N-terminal domain-containing protein n=1 Tax=Lysobacter sp. N42 TaxID=2545719 RepID=UPI001049D64D|nr:FKBP-type peptidyl-prolyl cis-trans isomerase [Lysobacter sp. N42]TCZ88416.1 FKBP-type peptidyl-prolyl cis-trans isomerase [Lysobacter sp. N42]
MKTYARGAAALLATAAVFATVAAPQQAPAPARPAASAPAPAVPAARRAKVSQLVGFDIAQSIAPVAPDMDLAAFERAIRASFDGGAPLLTGAEAQQVGQALMQRIAARSGQAPAGMTAPEVSKEKVGYLVGTDVGRSLAQIKEEIDLSVMVQALRDSFAGKPPAMAEAERNALREEFSREMRTKLEGRAAALATTNREQGAKFLAENKAKKGVFTTRSGLQYMVLRQGSGARPSPTDRVRVNYHGTLLDGTVFDSSYDRGQPAEFMLNQVIPGWTEGVSMMPVGAKYRFWVPSELGYGERGAGAQIGPNATLVFDVELLAIAP